MERHDDRYYGGHEGLRNINFVLYCGLLSQSPLLLIGEVGGVNCSC